MDDKKARYAVNVGLYKFAPLLLTSIVFCSFRSWRSVVEELRQICRFVVESSWRLLQELGLLGLEGHEEITAHLVTQPARGHARGDLEQVGYYPLVQAAHAFLCDDDAHGVEDALVLVPHTRHGVDLEAAAQHITMLCQYGIVTRQ